MVLFFIALLSWFGAFVVRADEPDPHELEAALMISEHDDEHLQLGAALTAPQRTPSLAYDLLLDVGLIVFVIGAATHEGHRLALHYLDTNPVRKHTHHCGPLHPWNLFQLPAPLGEGNKKDVAPDVFAEDRQHFSTAHFSQARSFNVARPGNAKARVALEIGFKKVSACGQAAEDDQSS